MIARTRNYKIIIFSLLLITQRLLDASGQFNWLRPYDTLIVPDQKICEGLQLTAYAEFGVKNATGYNLAGQPTNVLTIWDCTQDALAMLEGFPADSAIGQKLLEIDATDNGIRGNFQVSGDLKLDWAFALSARYFFWESLCLSAYLPFYGMQLKDVYWKNLTQNDNDQDMRVKEDLTGEQECNSPVFFQNVFELSNGLRLGGWNRKGPGDLVVLLEFFKDYEQKRPMLKNVGLHGRLGFNLPTGKKQNENEIFAVPFGYDGAAGIFGAGGLDITLSDVMELGFDVELLHLFGNVQPRRIKTALDQTELLLLAKVNAYKDYGLIQRFNLYAKIIDLFGPVSCKLGYQFFKEDASELGFSSCAFSPNIANTAKSLAEWTMHHFVTVVDYDFSYHGFQESIVEPYVSAFARIPFKGRNIALIPTIGFTFACAF